MGGDAMSNGLKLSAEAVRAMGYCPSCGNAIIDGVDCCGNVSTTGCAKKICPPKQANRIDTAEDGQNAPRRAETAKKRNTHKRTKAEAMALDKARRDNPGSDVIEQPIRLQLTGGGSYTPDLMVRTKYEKPILIEVKGGYRGPGWEQGIERYKRAKYEWGYWFEFQLCIWDRKKQEWRVE
jgi:hypothetical protein